MDIVDQCVRELVVMEAAGQLRQPPDAKRLDEIRECMELISPEGRAHIERLRDELVAKVAEISDKRRGKKAHFGADSALELLLKTWLFVEWIEKGDVKRNGILTRPVTRTRYNTRGLGRVKSGGY
jgi:hypothetical protein